MNVRNAERQGLVVFLVLGAAAILFPLSVRNFGGIDRSERAAATPAVSLTPTPSPSIGGGCSSLGLPVFRGAEPGRLPTHAADLATAVNNLGLLPQLTETGAWRVDAETWLAPPGRGRVIFDWYEQRMEPVDFRDLGTELRKLLGVRPRGSVDSPPMLYVDEHGAVLVLVSPRANATLLLMGCPVH
jgi:hypothetical protein